MSDKSVAFDVWKKNNCFSDEPEWIEAVQHGFNGAWDYQQKNIDDVLNLVCKLQYSSGERLFKEVKELLK